MKAKPETIDPRTRIGHVHLTVSDLERSLAFYRDALGFEITARYGPDAVFLSAGGYHHHIGLNTWARRGAPRPPPGRTGLYHFAILYPHPAALAETPPRTTSSSSFPFCSSWTRTGAGWPVFVSAAWRTMPTSMSNSAFESPLTNVDSSVVMKSRSTPRSRSRRRSSVRQERTTRTASKRPPPRAVSVPARALSRIARNSSDARSRSSST